MQEYFAMRDLLFTNGDKVFEKGHKYMGYCDGACLLLFQTTVSTSQLVLAWVRYH